MNGPQACRACLATDVNLHDINQYDMKKLFENVTGFTVYSEDPLPRAVCSYCAKQLRNFRDFQRKCTEAHDVMSGILMETGVLTTESLHNFDRSKAKLLVRLYAASLEAIDLPPFIPTDEIKVELPAGADHWDDSEDYIPVSELFSHCNKEEDEEKVDSTLPKKAEEQIEVSIEDKAELIDNKKTLRTRSSKKTSKATEKVKKVSKENSHELKERRPTGRKGGPLDDNIEVVKLTRDQQLQEIRDRQSSDNYKYAPLKCDKCFKGFLKENTYRNHMDLHEPVSGGSQCDVCFIWCKSKPRLSSHTLQTHKKKYICRLCQQESHTPYEATMHQKWHKGVTYDCEKCGKSFKKMTTYFTHIRLHHRSEFVCECGESFVSAVGLAGHRRRTHRAHNAATARPPLCEVCNTRFRTPDALRRHRDTSARHTLHGNCVHHCRECGESFSMKMQLKAHRQASHADAAPALRCRQCPAVFQSPRLLQQHARLRHAGGGGGGKGADGGDGAEGAEGAEKKFVCEVCGKKYSGKTFLAYHQRTHTGEKPYKCKYCPKSFTVVSFRTVHERIHTGERPYKCSLCPKEFKDRGSLNRHSLVHTGEKPYACSYCGKCFSQSNSMKLHVATVHHKLPAPYKHKHRKLFD